MNKLITIIIFIILFILDSLIFNGLGRWSALFFTSIDTTNWLVNSPEMSFSEAANTGESLIPVIASLIINIIIYFIIAMIITYLAEKLSKKNKN